MASTQRPRAFSSVSPLSRVPAKMRMVLPPSRDVCSTHFFVTSICALCLSGSVKVKGWRLAGTMRGTPRGRWIGDEGEYIRGKEGMRQANSPNRSCHPVDGPDGLDAVQ